MSGFDYFKKAFTPNYSNFSGRSRRSEYWYFPLFNTLIYFLLFLPAAVLQNEMLMLLPGLYILASLIPSLALAVRRLHDTNRSGWFLLLGFIPLVGAIIMLVFMLEDSQYGENKYGPNPKGIGNSKKESDVTNHLID